MTALHSEPRTPYRPPTPYPEAIADGQAAAAESKYPAESKYLVFDRHEPAPGRKTPTVVIRSKSNGEMLGRIAWYGRWRQFCFFPQPGCLFNNGCLEDIQQQIRALHEERARRPKKVAVLVGSG